jgi:hypothetical protein
MAENRAHVQVYSTRIPVAGWGSLAILGIAAAITTALPEARMIVLTGLVGGAGLAMLIHRRNAGSGIQPSALGIGH